MADLTKKRISGHTYWYLRECRRVDGMPKIVWTKYLGEADDIRRAFEAAENPPEPQYCLLSSCCGNSFPALRRPAKVA